MVPFIHAYTVDVRSGMRCERAKYPVGQGDALADRFVVSVMDGGTPVDLKGVGVVATVVRPDGLTVPLKGTIENGTACVTLDDKCYDVGGNITVTVSLEAGEMRQSVLQVALNVATGETDMIAETAVLNVADVLAAAERAEAAADRAESAGGGGGSGGGLPTGGAAHQQLVTDADGNATWEDRTHWVEYVDVVVLEETTLGVDETDSAAYLMTAPTAEPTAGGKYDVVWNGTTYACVGAAMDAEGSIYVVLGNASAVGGDDTGEPFCLLFFDASTAASMGIYGAFIPLDGSTIITISISGQSATVHPLDEMFLSIKNTNIVNSANGALRQRNAAADDGEYTLGTNAVAFGRGTKASGETAFASGHDTAASGITSHAEGESTVASGMMSHAEGESTVASGAYSHAEGRDTVAASPAQHVQGRFNIEDTANRYAHIVGNGYGTGRSNAHTVDWDGNAWFAGDVYIGGTSQDDGTKLATVEDVLAALPTWNGGAY